MKRASSKSIAGFSGLVLVLVFIYYYLRQVEVSLIYYWQQTVPLPLSQSLSHPGGMSELLADRFVEILSLPFQGFLLVAFLVLLVFFSLRGIFRSVSGNPLFYPFLLAALVPFIFLFAHMRLPFELVTSLAVGLALAMAQSYYLPRNLILKVLYNFFTGLLIFMIAGVPGLLVFIQVLLITYVLTKKYVDLLSVLPLVLLPLLYLPFDLSVTFKQALLGSLLVSEYNELPLIYYISYSAPFLLLLLFTATNFIFSKFSLKQSLLISISGIFIVLAGLFFSSRKSYDKMIINQYSMLVASFNKDWDEVIELAGEAGYINNLLQTKVNQALYGQGRLLDDMFSYPQQFGLKGIFLDEMFSSLVALHTADLYYDMGYALEARHWATEAQMTLSRHPMVLKQLVMSYIAIGLEDTARKYLRVLAKSRKHREWCDHVFLMLEENRAGEDPDIKFFRENNPEVDFFAETKDPVRKLSRFYSSNHGNQMAFEFLVAGQLLKHNVGGVVRLLPDFQNHGYDHFPRAVEEALMIYVTRTGDPDKLLSPYSISTGTMERFRDFTSSIANVKNRSERMRLVSRYKDSYWYYILFSSPYVQKR